MFDDIYSSPEKHGLEVVASLDGGGSYEFDMVVVWRRLADGAFLMGEDAGCSCPSPFEDDNDTSRLQQITKENFDALVVPAVWSKRGDWACATTQEVQEFLRTVREALATVDEKGGQS